MRLLSTLGALALLLAGSSANAQVVAGQIVEAPDNRTGQPLPNGLSDDVSRIDKGLPGITGQPSDMSAIDPFNSAVKPTPPQHEGEKFRAIAVPEPGALALTGLALAWAVGSVRKARKSRAE